MLAVAVVALLMPATPTPRWVPPLVRPLVVVRAFDPPDQEWLPGHRGVDLAATDGATVLAVASGRVSFAGPLAGRGVVVVVHGELRSTYEPVNASVRMSAIVAAGEPIGVLQTGHQPSRPAAAILHWGVRRGETYLDPMSLLADPKPVRLLPHWRGPPAAPTSTARGLAPLMRPVGESGRPRAWSGQRRMPDPVRTATVLALGTLAATRLVRRPP